MLLMAGLSACGGGGGGVVAPQTSASGSGTSSMPTGMRDLTSLQLSKEMSPGWNLGNTLEAIDTTKPYTWGSANFNETAWGNPVPDQAIFNAVKDAGFKLVRIPVSWTQYADSGNNISPQWMAHVKQVVDYARNAGLYVMLNVHWDGGWMNHPTYDQQATDNAKLTKFWTQIATTFKDYDDHLLFAGQNETHMDGNFGPPTTEWLAVQESFNQTFVNAVRATGGNNTYRHLVVQSYNTNIDVAGSTSTPYTMPNDPTANRLFMEVHFYDPYHLTLDGSSSIWQWGATATDPNAVETWANEQWVDAEFQKMKAAYVDKGIPVILGEFGIISKTEYDPSGTYRKLWTQYVTKAAFQRGAVPVWWDDGYNTNHTFGLFNRATGAQAFPDLIATIINAAK
jgi:endoglucanase